MRKKFLLLGIIMSLLVLPVNASLQAPAIPVSNKPAQKLVFEPPEQGLVWGIFHPGAPDKMDSLHSLENDLGKKFDLIMNYYDFSSPFPREGLNKALQEGRIVMLTLQPWVYGNRDDLLIPKIANGEYDDYLRQWARGAKEFGQPLFLRFANEMNGDWDPWCTWYFGKDYELYIKAWQRAHDIFQQEGATNVMWVWNPHDRTFPNFKWNNPHLYYPGDAYVDWIGLTGYNNGTSHPADRWRNFYEIYKPIYDEYRALYPGKPLMITEFSCNEIGGDKAAWISDAFQQLKTNFPEIKIAVWYNAVDNKWLYPLDSTPAAKKAFADGIRDPYYKNVTYLLTEEIK